MKPSGYDLLAQTQQQCIYINQTKRLLKSYNWEFECIDFLLVHSGRKIATHEHLKHATLPLNIDVFTDLTEETKIAFDTNDETKMIASVTNYHMELLANNLVF